MIVSVTLWCTWARVSRGFKTAGLQCVERVRALSGCWITEMPLYATFPLSRMYLSFPLLPAALVLLSTYTVEWTGADSGRFEIDLYHCGSMCMEVRGIEMTPVFRPRRTWSLVTCSFSRFFLVFFLPARRSLLSFPAPWTSGRHGSNLPRPISDRFKAPRRCLL